MGLNYNNLFRAAGAVTGATGAAIWSSGGVATARTGAGVYTLTLDAGGIDATQSSLHLAIRNVAEFSITYVHTSDTVKTVQVFNAAGAAADADFDFLVVAAPFTG